MALAKQLRGNKLILGTYGKCIIDGEEISAVKGLQAKIDIETEEVFIPDQFMVDNAPVKGSGKGSVTMHKIDSYFLKLIGKRIENGEPLEFTIVTQLKDPKSYGTETIALNSVYFTDLTLADWERGKNGEIEAPFVFGSFTPIDEI